MPDLGLVLDEDRRVVDLQHLVDRRVERPRQPPYGADGRVGLVALDLADDRFGDARLLRQLAERHVVGLPQPLNGLPQRRGDFRFGGICGFAPPTG